MKSFTYGMLWRNAELTYSFIRGTESDNGIFDKIELSYQERHLDLRLITENSILLTQNCNYIRKITQKELCCYSWYRKCLCQFSSQADDTFELY